MLVPGYALQEASVAARAPRTFVKTDGLIAAASTPPRIRLPRIMLDWISMLRWVDRIKIDSGPILGGRTTVTYTSWNIHVLLVPESLVL